MESSGVIFLAATFISFLLLNLVVFFLYAEILLKIGVGFSGQLKLFLALAIYLAVVLILFLGELFVAEYLVEKFVSSAELSLDNVFIIWLAAWFLAWLPIWRSYRSALKSNGYF